jgi:hypothetical protein
MRFLTSAEGYLQSPFESLRVSRYPLEILLLHPGNGAKYAGGSPPHGAHHMAQTPGPRLIRSKPDGSPWRRTHCEAMDTDYTARRKVASHTVLMGSILMAALLPHTRNKTARPCQHPRRPSDTSRGRHRGERKHHGERPRWAASSETSCGGDIDLCRKRLFSIRSPLTFLIHEKSPA